MEGSKDKMTPDELSDTSAETFAKVVQPRLDDKEAQVRHVKDIKQELVDAGAQGSIEMVQGMAANSEPTLATPIPESPPKVESPIGTPGTGSVLARLGIGSK